MIPQGIAGILSILLGLCLGSFLNVCIYRLPLGKSIISPPSHCPSCEKALRFYDNIPVLSYLVLAGRCRWCSQKISWRYPAVEILVATVSFSLFIRYGLTYQYCLLLVFLLALVVVSFIDLEHQIIPDSISIPGIAAGLAASFLLAHTSFADSLIGAAGGGLALFAVAYLYELAAGRAGMGGGDIKLLAMIGAWMGWKALPMIVFLSSLSGALIGFVYLAFSRKGMRARIPFGPFLSLGTIIYLFFGRNIERFYVSLLD